jgi:hypothetical protein
MMRTKISVDRIDMIIRIIYLTPISPLWLTEDNNNINVAFFPTYVPSPGAKKAQPDDIVSVGIESFKTL